MLKPSFLKKEWTLLSSTLDGERVEYFAKTISPKMNVIVRLELEHDNIASQHFNHYAMGFPSSYMLKMYL